MNSRRLAFLLVLSLTFPMLILLGCCFHHHGCCETCESGRGEHCVVLHHCHAPNSDCKDCLACSISNADGSAYSARTKGGLTDFSYSPSALLTDGSVSFFSPCSEDTFYECNTVCLYTYEYLSSKNLRAPPIV